MQQQYNQKFFYTFSNIYFAHIAFSIHLDHRSKNVTLLQILWLLPDEIITEHTYVIWVGGWVWCMLIHN